MSKPIFGYWNFRGFAGPIRLLLNYVGAEYEEKFYNQEPAPSFSKEEWLKDRNSLGLDFPNLPYYIDGKVRLTQSNAILRHLARKYNLAGETEEERTNIDLILDTFLDIRANLARIGYDSNYKKLLSEYSPVLFELLEGFNNWLNSRRWFAGDKLTFVDFTAFDILDQLKLIFGSDFLDRYPKLKAFVQAFENLPAIKTYLASGKFLPKPLFNKAAHLIV